MLLFLINPASSSGNGIKIWKKIKTYLEEENIPFRFKILKGPGDATVTAQRLCESKKKCTVVIVGGDGTVNEFLTGVKDGSNIALSVVPTGSGNDFVKGLDLPDDPLECLDVILHGYRKDSLDIGQVETEEGTEASFGVSSGIGYDAAVCHEITRGSLKALLNRLRLGKLVYLATALRLLLTIKPVSLSLSLDDRETIIFFFFCFAAAMNTRYEGGGYMFCPDADPCNGMLDVIVAEGLSRLRILMVMPSAFNGGHVNEPGIHIYRCKKAEVLVSEPSCVHTDGEPIGFFKKIIWSVRHEGIQVIR